MGACGSRSGSSKVYASTEDPLLAEVRARIAAYDDGGKGCPVGQLNAVLVDIGAEKLEAGALAAATKAVDPAGTGFMDADAFLGWFHSDPGDAAAAPPAEVHPSVAAGVKDEGEATGTGGYDDDLLDPAAAAAREAELERQLEEQLASEKGR